jgi:hypothetical protein
MTKSNEVRKAEEHVGIVSIIEAVCKVFEITEDELMSRCRSMRLTVPRQTVYYLSWLYTKRSFPSIGAFMDKDHTTVLYGRDKILEKKAKDKDLAQKIEEAKELAFEIELKKELAARQELSMIQRALEREKEIETETQRRLEKARKALSKKGFVSGDKIIFPRLNTDGQWGMVEIPKDGSEESAA